MMMVEVITDDESMSSRCKHDTVMLFIQMLMLRWRGSKAKKCIRSPEQVSHPPYTVFVRNTNSNKKKKFMIA